MKIIFFGNTKYSVIVAKALHETLTLSVVVTIPDSPVKQFALEHNIPVIQSRRLDNEIIKQIESFSPDFLVVADYGLILPKELLTIPKYVSLNVHHSLLPKFRGPSPAPSVILAGEKVSGVSIIRMLEQVDAGDILAQKKYTLKPNETTDSLLIKLNTLGGQIITSVIDDYTKGKAKSIPQDESKATNTKRLVKQDGYIDIDNPPRLPSLDKLDRMIRAFHPWPSVWTKCNIRGATPEVAAQKIIKFLPEKKIQVEGKKPMSYKDFVNGYPNAEGVILPILQAKIEG